MNYIDQIEAMEACSEALAWLREAKHPTPEAAWAACSRADWMLWLLSRMQADPRALVRCGCDIAETVLIHIPGDENRPRIAIETARRWARGEATEAELRSAARGAYASEYAVVYAAEYAVVYAVAYAAEYAAANAAAYAAEYAVRAARVAYDAAHDAHTAPAISADHADIVRRHFPNPPALEAE